MLRNHLQHDGGNWCIATWLISRSTNLHTSRHVDIQIFLPFFNFYNMKMDEWDMKQCLEWPGPDRCSSASHFGALPRKYPRPRLIPSAQWKHTHTKHKQNTKITNTNHSKSEQDTQKSYAVWISLFSNTIQLTFNSFHLYEMHVFHLDPFCPNFPSQPPRHMPAHSAPQKRTALD